MPDTTNLNRLGRKPAFTRFEGFQMLENRKFFKDQRLTADHFIDEMVAAGELKSKISRATMSRLLSGHMFPDLHTFTPAGVETNEPYDYSKVPKCEPGHPPRPEGRAEDFVKPKLTVGQQKLVDEIKRQVEAHVATQMGIAQQNFFEGLSARIKELEDTIARGAGFKV